MSRLVISICFALMPLVIFATDVRSAVKPVTGTWINLAYQDVRNKYTNPLYVDTTDPSLWEHKILELSAMGMEYLVFMAVANEGKAYYPSKLMPLAYSAHKKSPVDVIMDTAARLGMKVFMSTGWANNQDDNLRDFRIKQRQLDMMEELASLYGGHEALYGWYLPVEDCLCPILSDYAVSAVNTLTAQARSLTPDKKILISPYGIFNSAFENPNYERQLARLNVDIIAYQDEVGCVRENYPLVNLRKNWEKLRDIHNRLNIQLWANCETFTWEGNTNDRNSALVPAAYPRLLSQQTIASMLGVGAIISFMFCGIIENPCSIYQLGQPFWSNYVYNDYMSWRSGDRYWKLLEYSFMNALNNGLDISSVKCDGRFSELFDGALAVESVQDKHWVKLDEGYHELVVEIPATVTLHEMFIRMFHDNNRRILPPRKICLYASTNGVDYDLLSVKDVVRFANSKHDSWIEGVWFGNMDSSVRFLKIAFYADEKVYIDEWYVNPEYKI